MIKETILLTGTALMLFELPAWKRITASRMTKKNTYITRSDEERERYGEDHPGELFNWVDRRINTDRRAQWFKTVQSNPLHRKPFTCLYCMTFWIGLIFANLSFILFSAESGVDYVCAAVVAPSLAKAFDRWFNSLPVKI